MSRRQQQHKQFLFLLLSLLALVAVLIYGHMV